ncbi:hypothetical protein SS50377_23672 [Spironucleus salmonicida]|uniref:Uncharacterized protein n=1 Tax=Spironucleus salmonicida TaxID=348837 RepID=V6LVP2_9EUKA|nr:hypothetical protein SS50377_23672 [Spironucleus salmonicida]|eukprot:EST48655.1 Hypothetical protein SS50377_11268 [Spironucleus salmonicida]
MNDLQICIYNKNNETNQIIFALNNNIFFINENSIDIFKIELSTQKITNLSYQLPIPFSRQTITFNDESAFMVVNNVVLQFYEHQLIQTELEFVPNGDYSILVQDGLYVKNIHQQFVNTTSQNQIPATFQFKTQTTTNKNFGSVGYLLGQSLYEFKSKKLKEICQIKENYHSIIYFQNYIFLIGHDVAVFNVRTNQLHQSQLFLPDDKYILVQEYLATTSYLIYGYFILSSILFQGVTKTALRTFPQLRNSLEYSLLDHQFGFQSTGTICFLRNAHPCFTEIGNCQSYYQLEKDKIVIRNLDFEYNFRYAPAFEQIENTVYVFTQTGNFYKFSSSGLQLIITPQSPSGRLFSCLKKIDSDRLVLIGGIQIDYGFGISQTQKIKINILNDAWIYTISTNKWIQQEILLPKIHSHQLVITKSSIYIIWGSIDAQLTVNDSIYRIKYNQSKLLSVDEILMINQPSGRYGHTIIQHKNYCFILSGSLGIGLESPEHINILDIHKHKFYKATPKLTYSGCYQNYLLSNRFIVSTRAKFDFQKILDKFVHAKEAQKDINSNDLSKSALDVQSQYYINNNTLSKSVFTNKSTLSKSTFNPSTKLSNKNNNQNHFNTTINLSTLSNDSASSFNSGVSGATEKLKSKSKLSNQKDLQLIIATLYQTDILQKYSQIFHSMNVQIPEKTIISNTFAEFYFEQEKSLKQIVTTLTQEQKTQLFHEILSQVYVLHGLGMKIPSCLPDMIFIKNGNPQIRISAQYSLQIYEEIEETKMIIFDDEKIFNYNMFSERKVQVCYKFEEILETARDIRKKKIPANSLICIYHEGEPKPLKNYVLDQFVDLFSMETRHFIKLIKPFLSNFIVFPSTKRFPGVFYHLMIIDDDLNEFTFIKYLYQAFGQPIGKFSDIIKVAQEYGLHQSELIQLNWIVGISSMRWKTVVQYKNNYDKIRIDKYLQLLPNFAVNWIFSLTNSYTVVSGDFTQIEDCQLVVNIQEDDDVFRQNVVYQIAKRTVV